MKITYVKDEYEKPVKYVFTARVEGLVTWKVEDPSIMKLVKKLFKDLEKIGMKGISVHYAGSMLL